MIHANRSGIVWAILTGEYPPDPGGVSDYTAQVAHALAAGGDEVHVFAPPEKVDCADRRAGARVVRLSDSFGPRGLAQLDAELGRLPRRARLLIQYVPQAFGYRAMNAALPAWVVAQAGMGRTIDVMFHEVAMPLTPGQPLRLNAMGLLHRAMAFAVGRSADRIFVSTTWWIDMLRPLVGRARPIELLPIPSNVPTVADGPGVASIRARHLAGDVRLLVGHFGTYSALATPLLRDALVTLLREQRDCGALLIGRGANRFVREMFMSYDRIEGRAHALEDLSAIDVANHLAACDVLVQPYPDGVTTRRSSVMAGLGLGVPVVATRGPGTEPVWESSQGVILSERSALEIASAARTLLADSVVRRAVGRAGRELYEREFRLEISVERLRKAGSGA